MNEKKIPANISPFTHLIVTMSEKWRLILGEIIFLKDN